MIIIQKLNTYDLVADPGFGDARMTTNNHNNLLKITKRNIKMFRRSERLDKLLK